MLRRVIIVPITARETSNMVRHYGIAQVAARAGITIHQARCYVAAGLVSPCAKTEGGYHLFNGTCIARLRLIGAASRAGLGLGRTRRRSMPWRILRVNESGESLDSND